MRESKSIQYRYFFIRKRTVYWLHKVCHKKKVCLQKSNYITKMETKKKFEVYSHQLDMLSLIFSHHTIFYSKYWYFVVGKYRYFIDVISHYDVIWSILKQFLGKSLIKEEGGLTDTKSDFKFFRFLGKVIYLMSKYFIASFKFLSPLVVEIYVQPFKGIL